MFTRCASSEGQCVALREEVTRERQVALSRKAWWGAAARANAPWHALSGEYAPDSSRAEGSSIVDEPGYC